MPSPRELPLANDHLDIGYASSIKDSIIGDSVVYSMPRINTIDVSRMHMTVNNSQGYIRILVCVA